MAKSKRYIFKGISKYCQMLLKRQEDYDVEFKESIGGVESEDIVAFANSDLGGSILVGVKEVKDKKGFQMAEIIGCRVGDRSKQSILSRAESCFPPVQIEIFTENLNGKAFLRIDIPSGQDKPYCTSGGTYKIRGDGRKKAMPPTLLLTMFMEKESKSFLKRFQIVTKSIEKDLIETKDHLIFHLNYLNKEANEMRDSLEQALSEVGKFAEITRYESEETSSCASEIHEIVKDTSYALKDYAADIYSKVDALLIKFLIPDPCVNLNRDNLISMFWNCMLTGVSKEEIKNKFFELYPAATKEQFEIIYKKAKTDLKKATKPLKPLKQQYKNP